jgi:signal transduction histidine kinase
MKKLLLLVISFLITSLSASSQSKVDSLLRLCGKATEKQKAALYLELSRNLQKDTAKSNLYARQALKLAEKQKQLPEQAKSYYYLGETSYYSRNFSGAIPHYKKAIPLFESVKDSFNLTNCYNSIGLCYHNIFQGERAIEQFIKALRTCENDKEYTAEIISNIAMAHAKMNNYIEAIANYRKALAINTSIKDSASMAINYNGLGDTYTSMNKPDSAIVNFIKAHFLFKKLKNKGNQAITLTNIANIYPNYPDSLDKAKECFNQAWIIFKELGMDLFEAEIRQGIGIILFKQGKYKEALQNFNQSLQLTDKYNRGFALKKSNYKCLSELFEKTGDYKTALKYHVLFAQYTDSMIQKEKYEQIINLEKQYETEKKETQIIRLQARQELMDVQLQKNKQLKILGFVTASLLLVFLLFLQIRYYDKTKMNRLLEAKNKKIEQSEHELRVLNVAKNKLFSIIAHDLKNPFHSVMGYSYLLSMDYDRFSEDERRKFASDIHNSTNNIFRLLQNLLEWSKSQTGRLIFNPREIKFKPILENSLSVLNSLAEQKSINIRYSYDNELTLFADPQMIETILRNLINNAIKFTPENGLIEITAKQIDGHISICVKDTGVGISKNDVANLFRIDSKVKRKGTNNEDGSGFGLILCKEFVDKNKGDIWVNSSPEMGSSFFFTVPAKPLTS